MKFISKKLKILFLGLALVTGMIVASGYFYYQALNNAEDPRIIEARKSMVEYNTLMSKNETGLALLLLDRIEDIYKQTPGYDDSYELGVILNNRGSIFLIQVETDLINEKELDAKNLKQAKQYIQSSINIYTSWLDRVETLNRKQIYNIVLPFFSENDPAFTGFDLDKIIKKRVENIWASKIETKRRLSVSYTNLGIIYRYEGNFKHAKDHYEKAIDLWPENHAAKNNLNQLLGLPLEKRNILRQMFFKKRK